MPPIVRVQTGVRMERRMVKVLKGLAEYLDMSLGELLEGVVLHAFEGRTPFSRETRGQVERLKQVYGLTLTAGDSHRLTEEQPVPTGATRASRARRRPAVDRA
jgi:hypothetical protein